MQNNLLISSAIRLNLSSLSGESLKIFTGTSLWKGMEANMAKPRTPRNAESRAGHIAYWKQPWVQRVLQGTYSSFDKMLFMRIASFGADGCWMKNHTFMVEFRRSDSRVRRAITALWKGGEFWITGWDSTKRRIYATHNPEVKAMAEARYKAELKAGKVTDKSDFYRKNKTRGYKPAPRDTELDKNNPGKDAGVKPETQAKMPGYPGKHAGVGGIERLGYTGKDAGVHISKSRERIKELELRRADLTLAPGEQPNPPAIENKVGS